MAISGVDWTDGEVVSLGICRGEEGTTLIVEEWPRGSGHWMSAAWVGGLREPRCVSMVGADGSGGEDREAVKRRCHEELVEYTKKAEVKWKDGG